jgi:hypothetical protein
MLSASNSKKFVGALAGLALCTSSTGAIAASTHSSNQPAISPFVALSALGSDASRVALCGAAATAAAGAAAIAQAGPQQGCVLPVVDQALPPPAVAETLPPPPVPPPPVAPVGGGFGFSPLLLALAGIAAAVLVVVLLRKKNNNNNPTSPA